MVIYTKLIIELQITFKGVVANRFLILVRPYANDYPTRKEKTTCLEKMIALLTIFAMLVSLSSAVAADENTSQPTIEEILNSYHEKAFAAQIAEESGDASTYARSGSGSSQTLEQETVAELTAAGYEAYNVTGNNYETLEETLNTDFAEMGLDPNSSYILGLDVSDFVTEYTETSFKTLIMFATASWTRVFTQVYSSGYDQWFTSHHVEYAYILTNFGGQFFNVETGLPEPVPTQAEAKYIYSRYYHDHEWRMEQAVLRFRSGVTYYDLIGSIDFTYNGEVVMTINEVF